MEHIVIIGGGLAAAKAAESLREEGFVGELAIVGAEPYRPYERPPLSKGFLIGDSAIEEAFVHPESWFVEHDVRLHIGATAQLLDLEAGRVRLDSGEQLGFDGLVLATGAAPRVLDVPGGTSALTLRTIEDAERLKQRFEPGRRLVIIGSGWIGLEVAAAARQSELEVTVLERDPVPLRAALGERLGQHLAELHRSHGVDLRMGAQVHGIEVDRDTATGVITSEGTIAADIVVAAVGVVPNTQLAKAAGLTVDNGVVADDRLRTSDERVFAIGDVANAHHRVLGERIRVEHWDNAVRQGELVGKTMLGKDARYDWHPYFFTDQYEFSMEYVGRSRPDDQVEIRGDIDAQEFIAYWLRDGVLTAAMNVGIWDVNDRLRQLLGHRADPAELTDLR